jgi:hypothetical protein
VCYDFFATLIETENPQWSDLAVALGLEPLADRSSRDGC